ncbi:EPT/RTPC-like protein [Thozetella sp. PMI_491]|nr:EPT/RTPC-like protein [Thozetella sp. PMI_491]
MKEPRALELDGRTGEGGGQLVRIAVALASVTSQPIRIVHVRGNREGPRGGGLKSQHVTSIEWLAAATDAQVSGLEVGSHTLEFRPRRKPSELMSRNIRISASSAAASTLLVFQAVFPFLLFAGNAAGDPIELEISGGTNVSFSLSYEYLDQVLLPALEEQFGIVVQRSLKHRGWSQGGTMRGDILLRFTPLPIGETLRLKDPAKSYTAADWEIKTIDVSMVVPSDMHEQLTRELVDDLGSLYPEADVQFKVTEDSGKDARFYVLLVAHSATLRWGRDLLGSVPKKAKDRAGVCRAFSRSVAKSLCEELGIRGVVDEFLQDQLIVFQALAEGKSSFPRNEDAATTSAMAASCSSEELKTDKKTSEPWGEGSTHTTTARWVAAELLPGVKWYNKGSVCEGAGVKMEEPTVT